MSVNVRMGGCAEGPITFTQRRRTGVCKGEQCLNGPFHLWSHCSPLQSSNHVPYKNEFLTLMFDQPDSVLILIKQVFLISLLSVHVLVY